MTTFQKQKSRFKQAAFILKQNNPLQLTKYTLQGKEE